MKTATILVIDDEPIVRQSVAFALRYFGFVNVLQAENGEEGIEMINQHHPDLVITDLEMFPGDGMKVLAWIRTDYIPSHPKIKAIAMSGGYRRETIEETERNVKDAGAGGFLHKPFMPQALKAMIESLLAS